MLPRRGHAGLVILAAGCWAVTVCMADVRVFRNIRYDNIPNVDPNLLSLDVYTDTQARNWPVFFFVHGGGWTNGDKAMVDEKPQGCLDRGYVFVSTNYRLNGQGGVFPDHAEDVGSAIAWVYKNIARYGGDPRRIHTMGHSAGAHLVALVGTDPRYLRRHGLDLGVMTAVVPLDVQCYDINLFAEYNGGKLPGVFGETFGQDPNFWRFSSPITYVKPGKRIPPMIVAYSAGHDPNHPGEHRVTQAVNFVNRLNLELTMAEVLPAQDKTHMEINREFGLPDDPVTNTVFAFFDRLSPYRRTTFARDYEPGTRDPNGQFMGGTEIMFLVPHAGKLFAAAGYGNDDPNSGDPQPGPQVLVKESAGGPWRVDRSWGLGGGRIGGLKSVTFTTDRFGNRLDPPVSLLLASPQQSLDRATVWSRDDTTGAWTEMVLTRGNPQEKLYARLMIDHVDRVTGVHHVFAGIATSALFRGGYDPNVPGRIVWDTSPELVGSERMLSAAVANGELYVAVGSYGNPNDGDGGLFRRIDGPNPSWQFVYEWPRVPGKGPGLRGLTAVRDPNGAGHEVLIGCLESYGYVLRIDPGPNRTVSIEHDFKSDFNDIWNGLGGDVSLAAYNDMLPVMDPFTGEMQHVFGLWISHPDGATPPYNGSYFLVRQPDGRYAWGHVYDFDHPLAPGAGLRGTRTIAASPFPEEQGRALYFGGFDGAGGPWHNTAWIYRAELLPAVEVAVGDLNCDGLVDFGDVNPFVLALSDPDEYRRQYPECDLDNGDLDGDGQINFADINPFVALLSGV